MKKLNIEHIECSCCGLAIGYRIYHGNNPRGIHEEVGEINLEKLCFECVSCFADFFIFCGFNWANDFMKRLQYIESWNDNKEAKAGRENLNNKLESV